MGIIEGEIKKILSSLILSFSQIDTFRQIFYSKNLKGELCQIFSDLINNNSLDKIDNYIDKIKEKFEKNEKDIVESNIAEKIINFLYEELKKELINQEENDKLINELFNGQFELISTQNNSKEIKKIPLIFTFDLSKLNTKEFKIICEDNKFYLCVDRIIKSQINKSILKDYPEYDKFEAYYMPEIFFIYNINIKDNSLKFYRTIEINEIPYELIFFILDIDNKVKKYFNVNNIWYRLNSDDNKIETIKNIKSIYGTPKLIIYQKRNEYIQNFLNKKEIFAKENNLILDEMNLHIIPEHKYEKYYLLNKSIISELIKILNDTNESKEIIYKKAQYIIKNKNLLEVETEKKGSKLNHPKNFVIMRENSYVKFMEESNEDYSVSKESVISNNSQYSFIDDFNKKIYKIKFGENLTFIKIEIDNNQEIIYICEYNKEKGIFDIITFMTYSQKGLFDNDVEKYISNRGGLEYFYIKKKLNLEKNKQQIIKDDEGNDIGILINIVDMSKHLNLYKYEQIKPKNNYLENNFIDGFPIDNKNHVNIIEINNKSNNNSNVNNNQSQKNNQNNQYTNISEESSICENPIAKVARGFKQS
jgi:hypothetical protein